MKDIFNTSWS